MAFVPNTYSVAPLVCAVVALAASLASATDPWMDLSPRPADMIGTLSCTSASCHGSQQPRGMAGASTLQEYVHWLGGEPKYQAGRRGYDPRARIEKTSGDPHALAGQRMQEPRFLEVLRRYSQRADGSIDANAAMRCARCHDPLGVEHNMPHAPREEGITRSVMRTAEGIGCESCHGAARQWVALHYQRDISREQLTQLGMVDTKNLFIRARLCSSCHVGSGDNDMNHDMIAAGHPPLRFELASYEALIERKHWDDGPRRLAEPDYEVQLWAAGRVAAAEAALALLESRARRADETSESPCRSPWPEFAESNCFACHQALRLEPADSPTKLVRVQRGAPQWQMWNVAIVAALLPTTELDRVRLAMERSLIADPAEIVVCAAAAKAALRQQVRVSPSGSVLSGGDPGLQIESLLSKLGQTGPTASWDQLCHRLAALIAIERSLVDRQALSESSKTGAWRQRARDVAAALHFVEPDVEWPIVFRQTTTMSLSQVERDLAALREELSATITRTKR